MTSPMACVSLLVVGSVLIMLLWRYLRLRRALFVLWQQIAWSIRYAPRDKLVLEVGSGHNPHVRSDVLCDKYLYDDAHRPAGIAMDRPLVVGDAVALLSCPNRSERKGGEN